MRYRTLGRTGIEVSTLGLGGLFISAHGAERVVGMPTRFLVRRQKVERSN